MNLERESYLDRKRATDRMIELSHEAQRIHTLASGRTFTTTEMDRLAQIGKEIKALENLL